MWIERILMVTCLAIFLLIVGCASPYQGLANQLTASYQRGDITANEYYSRFAELEALDLQRRQGIAQSMQNAGAAMQLQGAIMNMNQPPPPQTVYIYPVR